MSEFLSDQDVAQRVLEHISHNTTDSGEAVWRESVDNYRSTDRFAAELQQVLRRYPTPFCPAAAVANPGDYVARSAAGVPLLVVRGDDGVVRGFRNACRHRGAQVAEGQGCARAFRCLYHGWTYRLSGELQHVPHEEGFPGLDKDQHGLTPVGVVEKAGMIFVTQDESDIDADLNSLPEFFTSKQKIFDRGDYTLDVNWKVFLETFLEGYHIKPAHKETFYPFGYDNLNIVESVGRNGRITFPFQRIESLREVPSEQRQVEGLLTYVYHLFPNVVIAVLTHHTTMLVLEPEAVDRTRVVGYSLTNRRLDGDEALEKARIDADFVRTTGQTEDIAICRHCSAHSEWLAGQILTH